MTQIKLEGSFFGSGFAERTEFQISQCYPLAIARRKSTQRSNLVAFMWKMAKSPMLNLEDPSQHGWTGNLEPDWGTEPYPEDIEQLLIRDDVDAASVDSDDDSDVELEDIDL